MAKYLGTEKEVKEIYSELKQNHKEDKDIVKELAKEFEKYLKKNFNMKLNEIGLFTVLIDDVPLVFYKEYQKVVLEDKLISKSRTKKKKEEGNFKQHICHLCGGTDEVSSDIKFDIKYYIKDKITFASDFDENRFYKNMQLCQNCKKILSQLKFILEKSRYQIGIF
ncbi:hypothetical protein U473_02920 [Tepidibacillus decaturensis]|uniref:Uncharacterized protein n=1 Tax=Tepidibacillus decaturensis TaxID=1413211 RepID=A0A135L2M0_9BACI|nr:hypothetical protein U473_02920 [Tepidibacillus decaturensis]